MSTASTAKTSEIKTRTTGEIKSKAKQVYSHWGLTLNDAINMFLVKSIEVGGLPFNLRPESLPYDVIAKHAYKASVDPSGVVQLPADWDEDE